MRKGEKSPRLRFCKPICRSFQLPIEDSCVHTLISWFDSFNTTCPSTTVFFLKFNSPPCSIVQVLPFNTNVDGLKSTVAPSLNVLICADRFAWLIAWLEDVLTVMSETSFSACMLKVV